jgi:hypothetical protein
MTAVTHPGHTGFATLAIDDRLAILNLLGAYTHYATRGDLEGWRSTFTTDATFHVCAPGKPGKPVPIADIVAAEDSAFADYRAIRANPALGERMIYRMALPYILEQSSNEATVSCELLIVRAHPQGAPPYILLTGTFSGTVVKRERCWRIHRWAIETTRVPDQNWAIPPQ